MNTSFSLYWQLSKTKIGFMVVVMTALGFYLGNGASVPALFTSAPAFLLTLLGTFISCCGSAALNNVLEAGIDSRMDRTKGRVLPTGQLSRLNGALFGLTMVMLGATILWTTVNPQTAVVALATVAFYVLVYTPLKQRTWWNTFVGAIPGALPPLGGWVAATGSFDLAGWILFLILFVWQHPHFYAIAWMYRKEYEEAGFCMLPSVDTPNGDRTAWQMISYAWLLLPVTLLLPFTGVVGWCFAVGSLPLSYLIISASKDFTKQRDRSTARKVLFSTLYFLPGLFALIVIDTTLSSLGIL